MFAKSILSVAAVAAFATSVFAAPTVKRTSYSPVSFDNWGGFSQLSGFDSFYGEDNFSGFHNTFTESESQTVVCHDESVEIVQQQLVVLREYAKRIVTESFCEVEVQTVVWSQFVSGFHDFSSDMLRQSGRSVGYDGSISSHIGSIHDSNGNPDYSDLGFEGSSVGSNLIVPTGNNWDSSSSPVSVGSAYGLSIAAGGLN